MLIDIYKCLGRPTTSTNITKMLDSLSNANRTAEGIIISFMLPVPQICN